MLREGLMKLKTAVYLLAGLIFYGGLYMLYHHTNFYTALAVFLMFWGNRVGREGSYLS
jgi:hypothetical protein